jgi:hypothetical protein
MTVPYSDFLSSAETAGGQRRIRARKRKKAKDKPETRRVVCVLVGRDMSRGEKDGEQPISSHFIFILVGHENTGPGHVCHVTPFVTISHVKQDLPWEAISTSPHSLVPLV